MAHRIADGATVTSDAGGAIDPPASVCRTGDEMINETDTLAGRRAQVAHRALPAATKCRDQTGGV